MRGPRDLDDPVAVGDVAHHREREARLVEDAGVAVFAGVHLRPQEGAVRRQRAIGDKQPVVVEGAIAKLAAEEAADTVEPVGGAEVDDDLLLGVGQRSPERVLDLVPGVEIAVHRVSLTAAASRDLAPPLVGAQHDVLSESPDFHFRQPRLLPPVVPGLAPLLGIQQVVDSLLDLPFPAGIAPAEVLDVALLGGGQPVPVDLGNHLRPAPPAVRHRHLDPADDVTLELAGDQLGRRQLEREFTLVAIRAFGATYLVVEQLVRERQGLAVGHVQSELVKRVALAFFGETQRDPLRRHRPAQIDLQPPGLRGIIYIRAPVGVVAAVHHRCGPPAVGAGDGAAELIVRFDRIVGGVLAGVVHTRHPVGSHTAASVHFHRAERSLPFLPLRLALDDEPVGPHHVGVLPESGGRHEQQCRCAWHPDSFADRGHATAPGITVRRPESSRTEYCRWRSRCPDLSSRCWRDPSAVRSA